MDLRKEKGTIARARIIRRGPVFDMTERCLCGHLRYEHHPPFGCMNWDERRNTGWCACDGFGRRRHTGT